MELSRATDGKMERQTVVRRASLVVTLLLALALPASAQAAPGSPLTLGLPPSRGNIPTTTAPSAPISPPSPSNPSGGLSGSTPVVIGIGAVVILVGISLFIWRDARRRAPVRQHPVQPAAGAGGRSGAKPRTKQRKLSAAEKRRRKRGRAR